MKDKVERELQYTLRREERLRRQEQRQKRKKQAPHWWSNEFFWLQHNDSLLTLYWLSDNSLMALYWLFPDSLLTCIIWLLLLKTLVTHLQRQKVAHLKRKKTARYEKTLVRRMLRAEEEIGWEVGQRWAGKEHLNEYTQQLPMNGQVMHSRFSDWGSIYNDALWTKDSIYIDLHPVKFSFN